MPEVQFKISVDGSEESAQQINNVRTALAGVDTELGNTTKSTGAYSTSQDAQTASTKTATTEGQAYKDALQHVDEVLGLTSKTTKQEVIPAQQTMIVETKGATGANLAFGAAMGIANTAAELLAGVIQSYIEHAKELITVQATANKQIAGMDFSAATASLSKTVDAMRDVIVAEQQLTAGTPLPAMTALAAIMTIVGDAFSNTAAKAKIQTEAVDKTWESFGKGQLTLQATVKELQAQDAALGNVVANAPSVDALVTAFGRQEQVTRDIATATLDLKVISADAAFAAQKDEARVTEATLGRAAAVKAIERAQEAYDIKRRGFAADELKADQDLITLKQSNAVKLAEIQGKQILDAAKIVDLETQTALAATAAGVAQVEAGFKAAKADADFYGVASPNLDAYHTARRTAIETTAALEIKRITDIYTAQKAANDLLLASLPQGSPAWQEAYNKGLAMDAKFNLDITEAGAKSAKARLDAEDKLVEDRRSAYARDLANADAHYAALTALGLGDVQAHLGFLDRAKTDENLSWADRQKFAKEAYDKRIELEEATFQRSKALGDVSEQEEVDRLKRLADSYGVNSIERIKAETAWALAAKKLREDVSKTTEKLTQAERDAREAMGLFAGDVQQFGLVAGPGFVTASNDISFALQKTIIAGGLAAEKYLMLKDSVGLTSGALSLEFLDALRSTNTEFGKAATPMEEVRRQIQGLGTDSESVDEPIEKVGEELADIGDGVVQGLKDVRRDSIEEVKGLIKDIITVIDTGASLIGDKIYQGLIDRLKNAIDSEALAS
jgi:hypothetical protein